MEDQGQLTDTVIDSLSDRIHKVEDAQEALSVKFDTGFADITRRLEAQASIVSGQQADLLKAIDVKLGHATDAQERNRPTFLNILLATAAMGSLVLTLVAGFGRAELEPMTKDITLNAQKIDRIVETTEKRDELQVRFDMGNLHTRAVEQTLGAKVDDDRTRIDRIYERKADKDVLAEVVKRIDSDVGQLRTDMRDIRDKQVSRSEFTNQWSDSQGRFATLNNHFDQLRHDVGDNFTVGDQLKNLQTQLNDLRTSLLQQAPNTGGGK